MPLSLFVFLLFIFLYLCTAGIYVNKEHKLVGIILELELELTQTRMAQESLLWVEVVRAHGAQNRAGIPPQNDQ